MNAVFDHFLVTVDAARITLDFGMLPATAG